MKMIDKAIGGVLGLLAMSGAALANPCGAVGAPACTVPEPSSWSLVVLAVVGVAAVSRFLKK